MVTIYLYIKSVFL